MTCNTEHSVYRDNELRKVTTLWMQICLVELVHCIDIRICVEGVEKEEWHQKLKEIDVDYLQGYLFGKPCDKSRFLEQFIFD